MDSKDFTKLSRRQAASIATYINDLAPAMVVQKTLRFIDGNFRAQGWQGDTFMPWKAIKRKGTILVKSGRLRRGVNYTTNGRGEVRFYNNVIYAKVHNEGLSINLTAKVKAFTRRRWITDEVSAPRARKLKFQTRVESEHNVKAHVRKMKIDMPQRQFMPYEGHESSVLNDSITRELKKQIGKLLTF